MFFGPKPATYTPPSDENRRNASRFPSAEGLGLVIQNPVQLVSRFGDSSGFPVRESIRLAQKLQLAPGGPGSSRESMILPPCAQPHCHRVGISALAPPPSTSRRTTGPSN